MWVISLLFEIQRNVLQRATLLLHAWIELEGRGMLSVNQF